jgi:hypothetical protein
MDFKTVALQMFPYWILGAGVLALTVLAGYKDVIRVEKKAVFDWIKFLATITIYRVLLFKLFPHFGPFASSAKNVAVIPWPLTLTVFWEDACHGLPLFMVKKLIGDRKWLKPFYYMLVGVVMLEFGLGHVYQGLLAAAMLSLYIPYSIKLGEKYGFGTVMLGHTLFDLTTILTVKFAFGL